MKKGDVGMAKHFSKKYGNKGWLSITLYLQSESISVLSGCLSMPDATSLHHCLKNKKLKLNTFIGNDQHKEYLILCTLRRVLVNNCI